MSDAGGSRLQVPRAGRYHEGTVTRLQDVRSKLPPGGVSIFAVMTPTGQ